MQDFDQYYQSFGVEVIKEVQAQVAMFGSLTPLLRQLGMPVPPRIPDQHRTLQEFLYRYGVTLFLKAVQPGVGREEIERMKVEKLTRHVQASQTFIPRVTSSTPAANPGKPSAPQAGKPQVQAKSAEAAPASPSPQPEKSEPEWIVTPTYEGPDRRTGKDRRQRKFGRRMRSDNVRVERRHGGERKDRRKSVRRASDRDRNQGPGGPKKT